MGMKAEQRRLAPFFRSDEHFLETDVCDLVKVAYHDGGPGSRLSGQVVAVSFTSHALYIRATKSTGEAVRVPYERIVNLAHGPGLTEIVTTQASWLLRDIGTPMGGNKFELLRQAILRVENHRQEVKVPGGTVTAVHRPYDEGDAGRWAIEVGDGVALKDPDVRAALDSALTEAVAQFGPLWPPEATAPSRVEESAAKHEEKALRRGPDTARDQPTGMSGTDQRGPAGHLPKRPQEPLSDD